MRKRLVQSIRFGGPPLWVFAGLDRVQCALRRRRAYPLAAADNTLSCRPLFIVSAGRSGTTLLRSMLAAGGEIAIPIETTAIPIAIRRFVTHQHLGWPDLSRLILGLFVGRPDYHLWATDPVSLFQIVPGLPESERSLARVLDLVFLSYRDQNFPSARFWGDQSPINTLYLPWIYRLFPHARFVHLLRDGRDAIASMIEAKVGAEGVSDATRRWRVSVARARALQSKLDRDQFLEIRYEDLVVAPEERLREVCRFCEVGYSPRMLDYWKLPTTIEHEHMDHHGNLRRPVFADSVGQWRRRLTKDQQDYMVPRIEKQLRACGYDF